MKVTDLAALEKKILSKLRQSSRGSREAVLTRYHSDMEGLTEHQVEIKRHRHGLNIVDTQKPPTWYAQLFICMVNPFNILLFALAFISWLTDDIESTVLMLVMAAISITLRFTQEYRSQREAEKLKTM